MNILLRYRNHLVTRFEKYSYSVGHRILTEHLAELVYSAAAWQSHMSFQIY